MNEKIPYDLTQNNALKECGYKKDNIIHSKEKNNEVYPHQ